MRVRSQIRRGAYYDSIVLMQIQRALDSLPGVEEAGVVMATPANLALLEAQGLLTPEAAAGSPDDLVLVVRAEDEAAAEAALGQVDRLLAEGRRAPGAAGAGFRPRSLEAATAALPGAGWVLVSVPGRYAAGVARDALRLGRHVFLYSDNVPVEEEVSLKETAAARGLLVLGPDCGTALVGGVGLGFANRVRRGPIGIVAASGTGLQAVASAVHDLGSGISHAIGTGGRDLSEAVGARTTLQAIDLLRRDDETQVLVLVSKPPAPAVTAQVLAAAEAAGKPVVVAFLGYPPPGRRWGNLHFAVDLDEAAGLAVELAPSAPHGAERVPPAGGRRYLRALFSGGTLAYQAVVALGAVLEPLYTNVPLRPEQSLLNPAHSQGHTILDLGADEFTVGRLHPMLDQTLRVERLRQEARDPETAIVLLDVILGEGAHPDPAADLAPAIASVRDAGGPEVVVVVVGTDADPQGRDGQVDRLAGAGAHVFLRMSEAMDHVARRLAAPAPPSGEPVPLGALRTPLAAINVGLESFAESLAGQGVPVLQVDWRPPAAGNERLIAILQRLKEGAT